MTSAPAKLECCDQYQFDSQKENQFKQFKNCLICALTPCCTLVVFYTAGYYHQDAEQKTINDQLPVPNDPKLIEPTGLQRSAILNFTMFFTAILIAQILNLNKLDIVLKVLQFGVFCYDIFSYWNAFQLEKDGAKICKTKDSFLTVYFDAFVILVTLYYLAIAYHSIVEMFSHFKKVQKNKQGLLADFDEQMLRLITRENRQVIDQMRTTNSIQALSTRATQCGLCKKHLHVEMFKPIIDTKAGTPVDIETNIMPEVKFVKLVCNPEHVFHFKCMKSYIRKDKMRSTNVCPICPQGRPIETVNRYKIQDPVDIQASSKKQTCNTRKTSTADTSHIIQQNTNM